MSVSNLSVYFRGLFTVVRHTDPPAGRMSIVFPVDSGGSHGAAMAHRHAKTIYVHESCLVNGKTGSLKESAVKGIIRPALTEAGYVPLDFHGKTVSLPLTDEKQRMPVAHPADEVLRGDESGVVCSLVGDNNPDVWAPLTRLPNLNILTRSTLDVDLDSDVSAIDAVIRLSGGELRGVRSYKALRNAFFEFFTEDGTVLVQPAIEDVEYRVPAGADGMVHLGMTSRANPGQVDEPLSFRVDDTKPVVFDSLPPPDSTKPTDLNHFLNFYPMMAGTTAPGTKPRPFVRVLGYCDKAGNLAHTMPGIGKIELDGYPLKDFAKIFCTGTACTCLASSVFAR